MRPQEMGQREASGRRQREAHPQQLQGGSELGAAEPCRSPSEGPPTLPGCHVNPLSMACVWGQKSWDPEPCLDLLLLVNPAVNKGGLASACTWGLNTERGSPRQGKSSRDAEWPQVPQPGTGGRLGSCPLPGAGLNQLGPSRMELPRPWHQTLIRKDPVPG